MKKLISVILTLCLILTLTACGTAAPADDSTLKVAIVQQLDHSSLNEIRTAVESQLNALAKEQSLSITIEHYNGQGDSSVLNQIGADVMSKDFDLIIPIATTAAQCMVTAAEGTDMPIVYAAISDPVSAQLTGLPTVTGVSDALNTNFIMDMMFAVQPDIQTVGLLFSNSEINSATPIAEAKAYLEAKGIDYIEKTGNTVSEITEAAASLVGRVDAVFTPTDNAVMAAEAAVAEKLNAAGIPHYAGADSFVLSGAFATCGVNYTELGQKTAQIAFDILMGGAVPTDFTLMDGGIITVNTEIAAALNLDYSVFSTMANTVTEVTTAK